MSSKSIVISKLLEERGARESYLRAKLASLIPSQIRALRLRADWTQKRLGEAADMKQARISAMESPGEVSFNLETLIRVAAAFKIGLWFEFVSHSELARRENAFSQDTFGPVRLPEDRAFLEPSSESGERIADHDYSIARNSPANGWAEIASLPRNEKGNANQYSNNGNTQMGERYVGY